MTFNFTMIKSCLRKFFQILNNFLNFFSYLCSYEKFLVSKILITFNIIKISDGLNFIKRIFCQNNL